MTLRCGGVDDRKGFALRACDVNVGAVRRYRDAYRIAGDFERGRNRHPAQIHDGDAVAVLAGDEGFLARKALSRKQGSNADRGRPGC